ncbi:MAG TPA: helix-turn-helix domain-containing protein [Solirubrobacterales bacterium]|nr:helix-turn-helix domain-containing protein [Solirubrobacterales bacterium]
MGNYTRLQSEMAESYGQFCPVAQAAEVLTERWTLLVLRELLMGSTRFNELQRGVPRMSSSLLSKRLREMERSGLITREPLQGERGHAYELTPAGEALGPLVVQLGNWSREWLKREVSEEEADPALLMWDMRRSVKLDRLPSEQVVVFFRYRDAEEGKRAWWLVAEPTDAELCFTDPGFGIDLQVDAEARAMAEVWLGQMELGAAMRAKRIRLTGPEHLVRSFPDWLGYSTFAYEDPAAELAARQNG